MPIVNGKVGFLQGLPQNQVVAPRALSQALQMRLREVASLHGGRVPIHGRLFAQWMHHAFPRELLGGIWGVSARGGKAEAVFLWKFRDDSAQVPLPAWVWHHQSTDTRWVDEGLSLSSSFRSLTLWTRYLTLSSLFHRVCLTDSRFHPLPSSVSTKDPRKYLVYFLNGVNTHHLSFLYFLWRCHPREKRTRVCRIYIYTHIHTYTYNSMYS